MQIHVSSERPNLNHVLFIWNSCNAAKINIVCRRASQPQFSSWHTERTVSYKYMIDGIILFYFILFYSHCCFLNSTFVAYYQHCQSSAMWIRASIVLLSRVWFFFPLRLGSQCKHRRTGCYQSHQTGTGWVISSFLFISTCISSFSTIEFKIT